MLNTGNSLACCVASACPSPPVSPPLGSDQFSPSWPRPEHCAQIPPGPGNPAVLPTHCRVKSILFRRLARPHVMGSSRRSASFLNTPATPVPAPSHGCPLCLGSPWSFSSLITLSSAAPSSRKPLPSPGTLCVPGPAPLLSHAQLLYLKTGGCPCCFQNAFPMP